MASHSSASSSSLLNSAITHSVSTVSYSNFMHADEYYKRAFIRAAFNGDLSILKGLAKFLVEERGFRKSNLKKIFETTGKNALLCATYGKAQNKVEVCKYLVETLKFDVNEVDDRGFTPLLCITMGDDFTTLEYLLHQSADPNVADYTGLTPLHNVSNKGRVDELRLLISKGANVNAQSYRFGTPLLAVASHGMSDTVEALLENHANPNLAGRFKLTPLVAAIYAKSIDSVRALLKWGADPNLDSRNWTPLVAAVVEGETETIKLLLAEGADPNVLDLGDQLPIEIAAELGNHAAVMVLFPVTKPIPPISDWSVDGILQYFNSAEAEKKGKLNIEEKFLELKAKGAEAFGRGDFLAAVDLYTEALKLKPADAAIFSNRSLCWARLKCGDLALQDAIDCITLRNDWSKAHYRAGMAYALMHDYREAVKEFEIALKLEPDSKELQDVHREAVLDLRQMHDMMPHGYCEEFKQDEQDEAYEEYISSLL